jgi:hypothetical protein
MELRPIAAPTKMTPMAAPRARMAEAPLALAHAPRQSFTAWLLNQTKQHGVIGELAKAARLDPSFPKNASADAVRARFSAAGADGDAFEALDDAERDYERRNAQLP